jgi:hypothetical protein
VNVVTQLSSIHSLVNLALTIKELHKEGKNASYIFIPDDDLSNFWNNIQRYVDPKDRSLIILDIIHPESDVLEKIQFEPWKSVILYLISDLNAPNKRERELISEKGISITPLRRMSECFIGDVTGENEKWIYYNKIISLEEKPDDLNKNDLSILRGIIGSCFKPRDEAIRYIQEGNIDFFLKLGREDKNEDIIVKTDQDRICSIEAKRSSPEFYGKAFETFLKCKFDPIAIYSPISAIFTSKPTYYIQNSPFKVRYRFGKGAIMSYGRLDKETISYFVGVGSSSRLLIEITNKPNNISYKTLKRRLFGGNTSERKGEKVYGKKYRSLKDSFKEIESISNDKFLIPQNSFENVNALLHESGATYKVSKIS